MFIIVNMIIIMIIIIIIMLLLLLQLLLLLLLLLSECTFWLWLRDVLLCLVQMITNQKNLLQISYLKSDVDSSRKESIPKLGVSLKKNLALHIICIYMCSLLTWSRSKR